MLYYTCYDRTEYDHVWTVVDIWVRGERLQTLDWHIESCVDDKAGYGSLFAADRMREHFEYAKKEGYTRADTTMIYTAQHARIDYLHFKAEPGSQQTPRYCYPRFDLGSELPRIRGGLKLINRIECMLSKASLHGFEDPQNVIAVLKRLRAVEITIITRPRTLLYCSKEKV